LRRRQALHEGLQRLQVAAAQQGFEIVARNARTAIWR
jgi:hypothetical protein